MFASGFRSCAIVCTLLCCIAHTELPQHCKHQWSWSAKGQWDFGVVCAYTPITQFEATISLDPGLINGKVIKIIIKCPGPPFAERSVNQAERVYCNLLRKDHISIPHRDQLGWVSLTGFTGEADQRPPFRKFLQHVHGTIQVLSIRYSRIGYLDEDFFHAYRNLRYLDLSDNDIYDIAVDTFQSVEFANSISLFTHRELNLAGNALQEVDLDVFKPLRYWTQWLTLNKQNPKLRRLFTSGSPYQLIALQRISLDQNDLTTLSAEVMQCMPQLEIFDLRSNALCSANDCTCCGMQPFLQWLLSASKPPVPTRNATVFHFRCGAVNHTNDPSIPASQNVIPMITSAISKLQSSCVKCKEAGTVDIRCNGPTLWDNRLDSTDSVLVRFVTGHSFRCPGMFHDLYLHMLEVVNRSHSQPDHKLTRTATFYCRDGHALVFGPDPALDTALRTVTLDVDLSPYCYNMRTTLLAYVRENFAGEDSSTSTPRLPGVVPVKTWISEHLTCPVGDPVLVSCAGGRVSVPGNRLNSTKSIVLSVRGDTTIRCRAFVIALHQYLVDTVGSSAENDADYVASQESIVVVCQAGRTVLSESNPQLSTKLSLVYYSAPNYPCQMKYRAFLNYIQESLPNFSEVKILAAST